MLSPPVRTDHLLTLVDDTGIIQHADGLLPNRSSGYCVDDVARLVIVARGLDRDFGIRAVAPITSVGLSFLRHAWDPTVPGLHNFMSYDRRWLDRPGLGDHVGRTVWALGVVLASDRPRAVGDSCGRLLAEVCDVVQHSDSPRTIAYTVIGLTRPPAGLLPPRLRGLVATLAQRLLDAYRSCAGPGWRWFEDSLSYDNGRLPQALIAAGRLINDARLIAVGLEALDWLGEQCGVDTDQVRLVGNAWRRTKRSPQCGEGDGDEQPLDCAALVEAYTEAFATTGSRHHREQAVRAYEWFLSRNRLGAAVYDIDSGGCHDGLGDTGMNDNEGAESTLAFFQAMLAVEGAAAQSRPRERAPLTVVEG